jgi:hypothetical protein
VIERLASQRGHEFSLERAAFLTVLHRLVCGGSDRAADRWREDYRIDGVDEIELHNLYRAMAWSAALCPEGQHEGSWFAAGGRGGWPASDRPGLTPRRCD